ncbi:MAG: hypothetical protein AAFN41_00860 [Planctomycetota bacterium]
MNLLGRTKPTPAYWQHYRRHLLVSALALAPWAGVSIADRLGHGLSTTAELLVLGVSVVLLFALVFALPIRFRRRLLHTIDDAGDIGLVCSACLYVSDAMGQGEPCPECGKPHPDNAGAKWIATGRLVQDEYVMRRRVRKSRILAMPDEAHSEGRRGTKA